ncbi:hypothetical protein ACQR16_19810 [Bradyrhizobium oligotrophicum]|uniref:hypothetical protein n=1 Tax=Bradyrhizobium oligotrophicum TaxID=44255 RepID=UPI003EBE35F8
MLPGFRFLVAAIVFSISLTIFGMGAAALLRAAHEQFASNSSWRSTQASGFTTFLPPADPAPVLAVLRVEPIPAPPPTVLVEVPAAESQGTTTAAIAEQAEASPVADATAVPTPSLPADTVDTAKLSMLPRTAAAADDRIENVRPDRSTAEATAAAVDKATDKPSMDTTSEPAAPAAPPVSSDVAVAPVRATPPAPQVLASADPMLTTAPPPPPAPMPTVAALDPIAAKLAALAEQPLHQDRHVASEHRASVKVASVQLRRSILKKRQAREKQIAARRAKQRRIAQRARSAQQAAAAQQQQQAFPDPFAQQPFGQPQAVGQQAAGPRTR